MNTKEKKTKQRKINKCKTDILTDVGFCLSAGFAHCDLPASHTVIILTLRRVYGIIKFV